MWAPTTKWENVYEFAEWPSLFAAACRLTSSWVRKMRDRDSHAFFAVLKIPKEGIYLVSAAVSCAIMSSSLVGMTQDGDLGVGRGDHDFLAAKLVLLRVKLDAEVFQTVADGCAHGAGVFADAGGKDDAVHAAQSRGIGADILADLVGELVERQLCGLVALFGCGVQIAEVGGNAVRQEPARRTSC